VTDLWCVREVKQLLHKTSIKVGAQNMHWDDKGAWTGEISAPMLVDCNVDLVELGHSERRAHFGETDVVVGLKTKAAIRNGMIPLICIGETLADRAYEPVWAIGDGGIPATSEYANARHAEIKSIAEDIIKRALPCLYGGSVNPGNCQELIQRSNIDGLFIGRSAWDADGYLDILNRCEQVIESN